MQHCSTEYVKSERDKRLLIAYFDTWRKTLLDGNQRGVQNVFLQFLAEGINGFLQTVTQIVLTVSFLRHLVYL